MAKAAREGGSLKEFDAYRDENGQGMTGEVADKARFDDVHAQLTPEPTGDAETARLASGFTGDDATAATEAETPAENIARISDPTLGRPAASPAGGKAQAEAIDRATAALGKE